MRAHYLNGLLDARNLVGIIGSDKTKTQTYCQINRADRTGYQSPFHTLRSPYVLESPLEMGSYLSWIFLISALRLASGKLRRLLSFILGNVKRTLNAHVLPRP